MKRPRVPFLLILTALIATVVPTSARAAVGDSSFAGCIGDLTNCTGTTPAEALDGARDVVVTPNGQHAYAAADTSDAISAFNINAKGDLVFTGCIGDDPAPRECTSTNPTDALNGVTALAITPDGAHLYAASKLANTVTHFTIAANGALTFAGCIGDHVNCTGTAGAPTAVDGAQDLVTSVDGKSLYVAAASGNAVSRFTIAGNGDLGFASCIGGAAGCTPNSVLVGAHGLTTTPDGKQLYAAASGSNAVSHFTLDASGVPTFAGCIGHNGGCTGTNPTGAMDGASGLAASPDSGHLYVTASVANTVNHFTVAANGDLAFLGCIGDLANCTGTTPPTALDGAAGVAMSPDGRHVYVAGPQGNALNHFTVRNDGSLEFTGCTGDLAGCTATNPTNAMDGTASITLTSDGIHLYATGNNVVAHFTLSTSAGDSIYWTANDGNANAIRAGSLDGVAPSRNVFVGEQHPHGVAIDLAAEKIYWADGSYNSTPGSIRVANLNGTGTPQNVFTGESDPRGLALDPIAGKVYWVNAGDPGTIRVGNMDGSGSPQTLFAGEAYPLGVALDPAAGKLYWSDYDSGAIRVGNVDGTGAHDLFTGQSQPYGIAVDPAAGKIYWSNYDFGTGGGIHVGNIDGSGSPQDLFMGERLAQGIAVDPVGGKIYWEASSIAFSGGSIRVGNLSGAPAATDLYPEISGSFPSFIALMRRPHGSSVPQLSGGGHVGQQMSCSEGGWDSDLLGGFLFRSPRSFDPRAFSYQWLKSGVAITGATSNVFTPSSAGSYACRVTATNFAGPTSQTSAQKDIPPPAPQLTPTVTPARKAVHAGGAASFTATVQNTGDASAGGVVVCMKVQRAGSAVAPRRMVCIDVGTLSAGASASPVFRVRTTSAAGGRSFTLAFTAHDSGSETAATSARLIVRP